MTVSQSTVTAAVTNSTALVISEAMHLQTVALTMDMAPITTDTPYERKRPDIRGGSKGTSVLKGNAAALATAPILKLKHGSGAFSAYADQVIRDLSFINGNPGSWPDMIGLHLEHVAFTSLRDLNFADLGTAIKMESHLSAIHQNIRIRGGKVGIEMGMGAGFSSANQIAIRGLICHWMQQWALKVTDYGFGVSLDGFNVEICGTVGNMNTGGIYFKNNGGHGLHLRNGWFESNTGEADVVLVNTNPEKWSTHVIESCHFVRPIAAQFTQHNIRSIGKNRIILTGNTFLGANDYPPDASRTYFAGDGNELVICTGNDYSHAVEQGALT